MPNPPVSMAIWPHVAEKSLNPKNTSSLSRKTKRDRAVVTTARQWEVIGCLSFAVIIA